MRVHFVVHGADKRELEQAAQTRLAAFSDQPAEWVTITAEPTAAAFDGTVTLWRGEVEAQV